MQKRIAQDDVHHFSGDMVGYRTRSGAYKIIEKEGLLGVVERESPEEALMIVDLFRDIRGEYFPLLTDYNKYYATRPDGKVEEVTLAKTTTRGKVVENLRGRINREGRAPGRKISTATDPEGHAFPLRKCL